MARSSPGRANWVASILEETLIEERAFDQALTNLTEARVKLKLAA